MKISRLILAASLLGGPAARVFAGNAGDPSAVNIKILAAWVSASDTCADPVNVFTEAAPVYKNMMTNPTFGSGSLHNGTYPCVIFKVSDAIKTTSGYNSSSGNCVVGHEYVQDIFRHGESSTCPDGTTVGGVDNAGGAEQFPCVYFRTGGSGGGAFSQATAIPISHAWTVSRDTDGTFVMDFAGKLIDTPSDSDCGVDPPVMTFR